MTRMRHSLNAYNVIEQTNIYTHTHTQTIHNYIARNIFILLSQNISKQPNQNYHKYFHPKTLYSHCSMQNITIQNTINSKITIVHHHHIQQIFKIANPPKIQSSRMRETLKSE